MINLLPQAEKKKLLQTYRLHLGILVLGAIVILELLAAVLFVPSFYILDSTTTNLADELAQNKKITPEGSDKAQQELADIKGDIAVLTPSKSTIDVLPSSIIDELLKQKPEGVGISALAYERNAKESALQLSGTANTREDLLQFQKNLKDDPMVADSQYSNSFILKKVNIDFTLTITLK